MGDIKARLINPHQVLQDDDFHEWVIVGVMKADKNGRPNPRMYFADWYWLRCNNPDCSGSGVVSKAAVIGLLDEVTP